MGGRDNNCSCCSGGCGKHETSLDHEDSDVPVDVNRYFELVVVLNELVNSGDGAKAERGTSLAQTLSKSHSSAIRKIKSIVKGFWSTITKPGPFY